MNAHCYYFFFHPHDLVQVQVFSGSIFRGARRYERIRARARASDHSAVFPLTAAFLCLGFDFLFSGAAIVSVWGARQAGFSNDYGLRPGERAVKRVSIGQIIDGLPPGPRGGIIILGVGLRALCGARSLQVFQLFAAN